jgi:hypothetical protein
MLILAIDPARRPFSSLAPHRHSATGERHVRHNVSSMPCNGNLNLQDTTRFPTLISVFFSAGAEFAFHPDATG